MEKFKLTLVKSEVKGRPYCKVDGRYAGPTWKNTIGLQAVPYSIEGVFKVMKKLSIAYDTCMVYGYAIQSVIKHTDRTMANFEEQPTYLLTLDLDDYEGELKDEYPTYEEAIREADRYIQDYLPPEFNNVSYILRFSSSFLTRDHRFKCHLVFLLADSQYPREIGTWIKSENVQTDPTFYFNLTQPIFTAGPVFKDNTDPLDKIHGYFPRVSLVKKEKEVVPAGWQPYTVEPREKLDLSDLPNAEDLPGKIGSFCRNTSISSTLEDLGYENHGDGRFLSPTSKTKLPGAIAFPNGYAFTHHSSDPISQIGDGIYSGKRKSFNSYDLALGWAKLHQLEQPELMDQFQFVLAQAISDDRQYQDEVTSEFTRRSEWLIEDGYTGQNKLIVDTLLYDMSKSGLNEMSRNYLFRDIVAKTKKHIKETELKKAWTGLKKDAAHYKGKYDPEAGDRMMAEILFRKDLIRSHHQALRGDFWCYYKGKRLWRRLNRDQTNSFIYRHLHEGMPLNIEINLRKAENIIKLVLQYVTERHTAFRPGTGWSFKGGKVGILMERLFRKGWKVKDNVVTLQRKYHICKELPITYDQWKLANATPPKFNDFLVSSCEEDFEKMDLLQEFMGYILADSYYLHKFLILEGTPGSGKSILVKIITETIGRQHTAALSLNKVGSTFGLGGLPNKKLVIMQEAREVNFSERLTAIPALLKISGNDAIDVEAKHQAAITERLECKMMIITNRTPVLPDDTGALAERIIMVRFHKGFRGTKDEILGLDEQIVDKEIPSIIKWSLLGLERLSERKQFSIPISVKDESKYYTDQLDPLKGFITEFFIVDPDADKITYVESKKFVDHYHEYLFRIGQVIDRNTAQKRASISALKSMNKLIEKRKVRNGAKTYMAIEPLVPIRDLQMEFISERSEMQQLKGGED